MTLEAGTAFADPYNTCRPQLSSPIVVDLPGTFIFDLSGAFYRLGLQSGPTVLSQDNPTSQSRRHGGHHSVSWWCHWRYNEGELMRFNTFGIHGETPGGW